MFCSLFNCSRSSTLTKLSRRLFATLCSTPTQQRYHQQQQSVRKCSKVVKETETFNTPRPPKDPPDDYQSAAFDHRAFDAPEFLPCSVFRKFSSPDEKLGPSASKHGVYKNPEYYSYHRFTYSEMLKNILELRQERICNDNAKCIYDFESDDEADKCKDDSNDKICAVKDEKKKDDKKKDDKGAPCDSAKK